MPGAPAFAAEVRSKGDYDPKAERDIRKKIQDYFAAGTSVVWGVDTRGTDIVTVYRATAPEEPSGALHPKEAGAATGEGRGPQWGSQKLYDSENEAFVPMMPRP